MDLENPFRQIKLDRLNSPRPLCTSMSGAEAIYLIKLNGVDPQAYLAYVLARLHDHPARRIDDLMPWNWKMLDLAQAA